MSRGWGADFGPYPENEGSYMGEEPGKSDFQGFFFFFFGGAGHMGS